MILKISKQKKNYCSRNKQVRSNILFIEEIHTKVTYLMLLDKKVS